MNRRSVKLGVCSLDGAQFEGEHGPFVEVLARLTRAREGLVLPTAEGEDRFRCGECDALNVLKTSQKRAEAGVTGWETPSRGVDGREGVRRGALGSGDSSASPATPLIRVVVSEACPKDAGYLGPGDTSFLREEPPSDAYETESFLEPPGFWVKFRL